MGLALALMAPLWGGCAVATGEPDGPSGEASDELGQDIGEAAPEDVDAGEEGNDVDGPSEGATSHVPLDWRVLRFAPGSAARSGTTTLPLMAEEKQDPEPLPWHQDGEASSGRGGPAGSDKAH